MTRRCGSYELLDLLGRGGMGEVWRARHAMLGRLAAVKLILPEMLAGDAGVSREVLKRFEREVQATSALRSPHTVEIWDFGTTDDGGFYYAMELLDGVNLQTLVERHGPVPAERAVHFLLGACDSLAEAHHHGLVHRDVKPANLFTCQRGLRHDFVKVLDFGLVKPVWSEGKSLLTVDGRTMGSPAFMPPEVAEGHKEVDARADVYALGCVGYWLLTGRLVFEGETPLQIILKHVKDEPVPPSRRPDAAAPPAELEEVILRCLRKRPEDRPPNARELARLLEAVPLAERWTEERAAAWWSAHAATRALPPVPAPAPAARPVAREVVAARRERAIAELQEQFVKSRIDATELGRRVQLAERAGTPEELDLLVRDLPALRSEAKSEALVPVPVTAPAPAMARRTMLSIFSGRSRKGAWVPARELRVVNVFGGTELDFRDARLQPGCTTIQVWAVFGGCEITIPDGLYVEVDGTGIFGGFEDKLGTGGPPVGDTPWLRITGVALFGGVSVKVVKPGPGLLERITRKLLPPPPEK